MIILFQSYWFTLGTTILYSCSDCLHVQVIRYIKSEWCSDRALALWPGVQMSGKEWMMDRILTWYFQSLLQNKLLYKFILFTFNLL